MKQKITSATKNNYVKSKNNNMNIYIFSSFRPVMSKFKCKRPIISHFHPYDKYTDKYWLYSETKRSCALALAHVQKQSTGFQLT